MTDRATLIARKQQLRSELEHVQRELERVRQVVPPAPRQIRQLEARLERLMGEEYNLRLAIDRAGRNPG